MMEEASPVDRLRVDANSGQDSGTRVARGSEERMTEEASPADRFRVDAEEGEDEGDDADLEGGSGGDRALEAESAMTHELVGAIAQDLFGGIWTWDNTEAPPERDERDEAELCSYLYGQVQQHNLSNSSFKDAHA
jgi:hypothetical protein